MFKKIMGEKFIKPTNYNQDFGDCAFNFFLRKISESNINRKKKL